MAFNGQHYSPIWPTICCCPWKIPREVCFALIYLASKWPAIFWGYSTYYSSMTNLTTFFWPYCWGQCLSSREHHHDLLRVIKYQSASKLAPHTKPVKKKKKKKTFINIKVSKYLQVSGIQPFLYGSLWPEKCHLSAWKSLIKDSNPRMCRMWKSSIKPPCVEVFDQRFHISVWKSLIRDSTSLCGNPWLKIPPLVWKSSIKDSTSCVEIFNQRFHLLCGNLQSRIPPPVWNLRSKIQAFFCF